MRGDLPMISLCTQVDLFHAWDEDGTGRVEKPEFRRSVRLLARVFRVLMFMSHTSLW